MSVRWVLHLENLERVDAAPLLSRLAEEVVADAKRIVPVRTGRLRASIHVAEVDRRHAVVQASAPYAGYVELGTRYMAPQPYLRPALYRQRG